MYVTSPAEAAHDWPDFLDVPGRSAETCVLLRHMTGRPVATEDAFFARLYGLQEADGLFYRPETAITSHAAHREEQALVMGALLARAIADEDDEARRRLAALVGGLARLEATPGSFPGMLLRPLVRAYEALGIEPALVLAERLRDQALSQPLFRPDGTFAGHVHSHLYAAAGLAELGRLTDDVALVAAMDQVFRVMRSRSTSFGFVPELTERQDDLIACETCCLMDYLHLALALARAGHREYYDDLERAVRNHLVESRVRDGGWLPAAADARDEELLCRVGLRDKVLGAYAGWSSPNHILAYDEHLPPQWVKSPALAPIYLRKVRALQNCCSPSGPKALYLAWQHASVVVGDTLWVNLLLDRSLPEAEVRGREPFEGRLDVTLHAPLQVALRVPAFASAEQVTVGVNGAPGEVRLAGGYLTTTRLPAGAGLTLTYPLPAWTEPVTIGNEGFQGYKYELQWRGSTVMRVRPGENPATGRSHLMAEPVRLYYGSDGPHPLYERARRPDTGPQPGSLHATAGPRVW